jgi:hypothetical protein
MTVQPSTGRPTTSQAIVAHGPSDDGPGSSKRAAEHATSHNSSRIDLPIVGRVDLPPAEQLGFYAGLGVMVAVEVLEWPVAVVLGLGHLLMSQRNNKTLRDFGQALDEA